MLAAMRRASSFARHLLDFVLREASGLAVEADTRPVFQLVSADQFIPGIANGIRRNAEIGSDCPIRFLRIGFNRFWLRNNTGADAGKGRSSSSQRSSFFRLTQPWSP